MADSGEYDQATLQRRYAMAQALMKHDAPIKHWAEGLGNMAESALGGYQMSKLDDQRRAEKASEKSDLYTALGLTPPAAAPEASQGGFQRLAALLNGGGAGAPAGPVEAPAAMAAAPPPAMPPPVAPPAPRPVQMASLGPTAAVPEAAPPPRAPVEEIPGMVRTNPDGSIAGNMTAPTVPVPTPAGGKIAAALAGPGAGQPPAGGGALASVPPETKMQIAQLLTSRNPTAKALGMSILQQATKPNEFGFQNQPDGTILRTDPRKGTVEPVYQGATKPTFGVIGEEDGKKTYGFIDAAKGTAVPLEPAKPGDQRPTVTGPDGKEIVIPKGVDVPTFRKEISKINADAAGGKMTEVQGNAQQFANRMEAAQAAITPEIEKEALGMGGAAQQVAGKIPVVGSALQTEAYQKYAQAKSQFITSVLRKESGAAISKEEFNRYDKEFFPQPGDKPETIKQKAQERRVAVDAMKRVAGPSYKSPDLSKPADEGWQDMGGGVRIREKK